MVSERDDRAQLILIGAITLAFIILGVVVVFNGVLYTETLSSGGTSQSASNADAVELEVEQGVGCLLVRVENDSSSLNLQNNVKKNITTFNNAYQNKTVNSTPAVVNISVDNNDIDYVPSPLELEDVDITITYNSNELSFRKEMTVEPEDCPTGGP